MSDTVVLDGIRWETYEQLRDDLDAKERQVHLTFDRGCLEIEESPLPIHEDRAWLLAHVVEIVAEERGIDYLPGGSTTFRRGALGRGAEPDACYFLGASVPDAEVLDPDSAAPDLVIEVDITHRTVDKIGLYAGMGVAEVWQDDGAAVTILVLEDGAYVPVSESRLLPGLDDATLTRFAAEGQGRRRTAWLRAVRAWARQGGPR